MLALDAVTYRYAGAPTAAIHGLSLGLAEKEVVGLVGANESGKSTVCLIASGLAPRAIGGSLEGRLLIDGEDVRGRPMHELVGQVGICFQNPETQLSGVTSTVFEEVAFGSANLGVPREELFERTSGALETLRISDLAGRDPRRLSGGQMQLVAIAGLLALRARYLILDEPTAQLDPAGSALVVEALRSLAEGGSSIMIAEHKTDLLVDFCHRIVVLDRGRISTEGPAATVVAGQRLPQLGVALPARVRLSGRLEAVGIDPRRVDELIRVGGDPGGR
jgi:energy-coupling factor transport system ATP-binding protein